MNQMQFNTSSSVFSAMRIVIACLVIFLSSNAFGQQEKTWNYRKYDERTFHFGFMLGFNTNNYTAYQKLDAYSSFGLKSMEVKRQAGGQLGVLTSIKLGTPVLRLRVIPTLSFQERAIIQTFEDPADLENDIINEERVNSTNIDIPIMLQFRTLRLNNFAAYAFFGGQYSVDLQSQQNATQSLTDPFIKMRKHDLAGQVGGGVEFFATYFKFGVELKYSHSLFNGFIQDNSASSNPIMKLYNNGWWFSLIFEG